MINKIIKPGDSNFNMVPAQDVLKFHENDDVDHDHSSHHHTLGGGPNQAAAGNHYDHNDPFWSATMYKVQLIPTGAWTELNFWSPHYVHPDITMKDGPEQRTNFYFAKAGLYDIRFCAMFRNDVNSNGVRGVQINLNSIIIAGYYSAPIVAQADYVSAAVSCLYRITAGQWLQFMVLQNTGGNVNIHSGHWTQMSLRRVGD